MFFPILVLGLVAGGTCYAVSQKKVKEREDALAKQKAVEAAEAAKAKALVIAKAAAAAKAKAAAKKLAEAQALARKATTPGSKQYSPPSTTKGRIMEDLAGDEDLGNL